VTYYKTSDILKKLATNCQDKEYVLIDDIRIWLHQFGFAIIMIMFALPCSLPLPGISMVGGIPLAFFATQIIMGYKEPWIPRWIAKKTLSSNSLIKIINKAIPYLEKFESFYKVIIPIKNMTMIEKIMGIFSLIFAIYIILPVIFGNSLPSLGIILMCLGLVNYDLLIIIIGIIVGMVGVILASGVIIGGIVFVKMILSKVI